MQSTCSRFRHVFLAFDHQLQLTGHFPQFAKNVFIPGHEAYSLILDTCILAESDHQLLQASEIVTGYAGEQVVDGLELQTPMDEIQPRRTFDIHGCSELMLGEALRFANIARRHRPMRQSDLHVQRHRNDMRDQYKHYTQRPGGNTPPDETIAEKKPIHAHEADLCRTCPCGGAERGGTARQ